MPLSKLTRIAGIPARLIAMIRREGVGSLANRAVTIVTKEGWHGIASRIRDRLTARNDYSAWIKRYDHFDASALASCRADIAAMAAPPRIAVVMPVYNANVDWLVEAIESVRNQLYPHWELCIADDASTTPEVRLALEKYAQQDARIRVIFREKNGHISAASNSALTLVTAEWVALLDQDDLLPVHALYTVAQEIIKRPTATVFYSDEDKIDGQGARRDPYFKCDINLDLLLSHNMVCHLGVYKKQLLDDVGGFREGLEGAQDYDLALRCLDRTGIDAVAHIPHVLYHWRVHSASTAAAGAAKPYAAVAGEKALNDYFVRRGIQATAETTPSGYRARYRLPDVLPLVTAIIPTRNGLVLLKQCIDSIVNMTDYRAYEIVIVDNGSDDPATLAYLATLGAQANVRVLRDDRPFNFSMLNNTAVAIANGSIVALLNNDIEVISRDWLGEMVSLALQPGVGAVGAKLLYPDGTIQHAGVVTGVGGVAGHAHKHLPGDRHGYFSRAAVISSFSAVTAACLVVRKSTYQEVGGFDEAHLAVAFNDVDFCLRIKEAGYRNVWTPYAALFHHESATRGVEDSSEKVARFNSELFYMQARWGAALNNDPAYSPNLTLDYEDFGFAWPPRTIAPLRNPVRNTYEEVT